MLDTLPESVFRVCDLMVVVLNRNGAKFREQVLTSLVAEVWKEPLVLEKT